MQDKDHPSSARKATWLGRLKDRFFPPTPDFFALLNEQCDVAVEAMQALVEFMNQGDPALAQRVADLEHHGDDLKHRNMDQLNLAFVTPIDREDIFRAIVSIDDIIGYAKTTVREMEILEVSSDQPMREMSQLLLEGVECLRRGYRRLPKQAQQAEQDSHQAHKTERKTEKIYRRAVAALFDEGQITAIVTSDGDHAVVEALTHVVRMLRRRELYRHLSNAADRVEIASEVLHDIIVKMV